MEPQNNLDEHAAAIEKLTARYRELQNQQVRAETNLEMASSHLAKLRQEAQEKYGTCDVDELKAKLDAIESENAKKQLDYERHLDEIEKQVAEIEKGDKA